MQNELTAERIEMAIAYWAEFYQEIGEMQNGLSGGQYELLEEQREPVITALAALRAEKEREWISVEDRLPEHPPDTIDEKGRLCFCTTNHVLVTNGKIVYPACFEHQGKQPGYFWYRDSLNEITDITHWMPLPKPPKEDSNAAG